MFTTEERNTECEWIPNQPISLQNILLENKMTC